jgi:FkbM family methyltransferase
MLGKQFVQRQLAKRGIHVHRMPSLVDFLASRAIDVVLDVGANTGQFAKILRNDGYRGRIVSFEPTAGPFAELAAAAARDPLWEVHKNALGSVTSRADIHLSENSVFNSIADLSAYALEFDPEARVVGMETVDVIRLDDFLDGANIERTFLKIDTQGFERQVLDGSPRLLECCPGVLLELPVNHLYEGVWSLGDAINFMSTKGYSISQVRPVAPLHHDPVSTVELDCLFRRT